MQRFFFFLLLFPTLVWAQTFPSPLSSYVNDYIDIIDEETEARISETLRELRQTTGVEMTVVTINSRHDYGSFSSIADFGTALFNAWGVGNKDRNDGILVVVAKSDRDMRVALGSGYPPVYDDRMKRVIDHYYLPYFKEGLFAKGIEAGVAETIKRAVLETAAAAETPRTNLPVSSELSDAEKIARQQEMDRRESAYQRRSFMSWALGFVSFVSAIAGGWYFIRWRRNRPRFCDICTRAMIRLSEDDEDTYLNRGQTVEERVGSKDYDVWLCPHDDHIQIESYGRWFSGHSACGNCGFKTLHSQRTTLVSATTSSSGRARVDYSCKNCGHSYSETVTIPRKSTPSSSSSSSSAGGSFGGGSSSGGGASGSW